MDADKQLVVDAVIEKLEHCRHWQANIERGVDEKTLWGDMAPRYAPTDRWTITILINGGARDPSAEDCVSGRH